MRTLMERAKPSLQSALTALRQGCPVLAEVIDNELNRNHWFTDLKYGTFVDIKSIMPVEEDRPHMWFEPSEKPGVL